MIRIRCWASAALTAALLLSPHPAIAQTDWTTKAEATGYRETPTYEETLDYIRRIEKATPTRVRLDFFGTSEEGRPIPFVVVDRDGLFTPKAVRSTAKAVVLVLAGIHSGEIDGKDASLSMLRELAATHSLSHILTNVTVIFVPIYNVDGHERRSRWNRINQNGPREMGFRTNARGLDLNRDFLKADSPEAQAFARLFTAWRPDLLIDCHVTDGADYRYDVTWSWQPSPAMPRVVSDWMDGFVTRVQAMAEGSGHLLAPYIWLRDETAPEQGMDGGVAPPRFSTGYAPLRNRPAILIETHVYKEYGVRVKATHDMLRSILHGIWQSHESLCRTVDGLDRAKTEWGRRFDPKHKVVLRWGLADETEPFVFKTWKSQVVTSEVTGGRYTIYSREPLDVSIPYRRTPRAEVEVSRPTGYLVPSSRSDVAAKLEQHGLRVVRLDRTVEDEFEMYRASNPSWENRSYQGRHPVTASIEAVTEKRAFPKGSFWVPLDQPDADVAIQLLEPQAPDSLFAWGEFDGIFERKEYYEPAVIERLIARRLIEEPELVERLGAEREKDPKLKTPEGMREWFYRNSPYWDGDLGLYPVARVTTQTIPEPEPAAKATPSASEPSATPEPAPKKPSKKGSRPKGGK
jgi:hypothetical protein